MCRCNERLKTLWTIAPTIVTFPAATSILGGKVTFKMILEGVTLTSAEHDPLTPNAFALRVRGIVRRDRAAVFDHKGPIPLSTQLRFLRGHNHEVAMRNPRSSSLISKGTKEKIDKKLRRLGATNMDW